MDAHRPIDTDCRWQISLKALLNYLKQAFLAPYSPLILIDLDPLLSFWTHCDATFGQTAIPIEHLPIYVFDPPAKPPRLSIYVDARRAAVYGEGYSLL